MNMNKEYRNELRDLKAQEREIARGLKHVTATAKKEITSITRNVEREARLAYKQLARIGKRRAILKGRLS
ncbi:MAG TPA: hypothetical protein PKA41_08725 [Verrucomicrobiota bacterium]|nr:hypothetical protein [Verrucomicrobiota bacterium]